MRSESKYFSIILLAIFCSCNMPVARFLIDKEGIQAPATIKFQNQSEKAESYEWDFGDGNTSVEEAPTHKYYLSGNYIVKLKAIKANKINTLEKNIKIEAPDKCLVEIETNYGSILVHLFDETPKHRDNFIELTEKGYFDDLLFHRVIEGFMIQGGDPDSKDASAGSRLGGGGPGYKIPAEINENLVHVKGALAAARQGDGVNPNKESSGSQFYIVHGKPASDEMLNRMELQKNITYSEETRTIYKEVGGTPFLDNEYTVFGQVISGMEVIDAIASTKKGPGDRPTINVKMKIRVIKSLNSYGLFPGN